MKKIYLIGCFLLIILVFSGFAAAKETQNEGKPFQQLWDAISELTDELNYKTEAQNSTNEHLQEQIDNLESTAIKGFYIKTKPNCREGPSGGSCQHYAEAICNSGDRVTGGGFSFTALEGINEEDVWTVSKSMPNSEGTGWYVEFTSECGSVDPEEDLEFTTYAICADMT
jgi:hypothetical protein